MKKISFFVFIAVTLYSLALVSCQEKETPPCEGLMNESPPLEILVQSIDKETGEPLKVDAKVISVTDKKSGQLFVNWLVYERPPAPELDGAMSLRIFNETPGIYEYEIQLGEKGSMTLSYKVERTETEDVCRPYAYPIVDIKIVDRTFEIFKREGKSYPKILVVRL